MKYECECCGKLVEKTITCSDKCRKSLARGVRKTDKVTEKETLATNLVRKTDRDDIFTGNRFELCTKHKGSYKMTCGCK